MFASVIATLLSVTACNCQFVGSNVDNFGTFNPCKQGFERHLNSCYRFVNISSSWAEAVTLCDVLNVDLAEVNTADENLYLTHLVRNNLMDSDHTHTVFDMSLAERVWVGASNIQGILMWMATGTPLTYIPWAKGEPIMSVDTAVYCVMKMGNDWYSDKCTHSRPFICEQAIDGLVMPQPSTTTTVKPDQPVGK